MKHRKCDTTKHRKQTKKARDKKRVVLGKRQGDGLAKQIERKILDGDRLPEPATESEVKAEQEAIERIAEATKPISPARRAFQDV